MIEYKIATVEDIDAMLKLHAKYQLDTIKEEDKKDGFVTTAFTKEELTQLIEQELFIAYIIFFVEVLVLNGRCLDILMKDLPNLNYKGIQLSTDNSYTNTAPSA